MTRTSISKSTITNAILRDINERFTYKRISSELEPNATNKITNIVLVMKNGSEIDFDSIDRIYVEY